MRNFWLVFYDEMRNFDKLRKAKCIDQLQQSSFADTFFNFPDRSRTRAVETDPNPRTRAVETPVRAAENGHGPTPALRGLLLKPLREKCRAAGCCTACSWILWID